MIIPKYLNQGDLIGITACSCGVLGKIEKYENSISNVRKQGFQILETDNVRTDGLVSSSVEIRAKEFQELLRNDSVKMINIAAGGDFLYEVLPYIPYELLNEHIKWIGGSSDPTSLLYIITTNYDIATIYTPCNMSGFSSEKLHQSYIDYFQVIQGNLVKQYRSLYYESSDDVFDQPNEWIRNCESIDETGILIGGCIECLKDLIGTKFDKTISFIEKYKEKGIIWYFDVFSMASEDLYRTLLQFENAGWFQYTDLIIIGKVKYPSTFIDLSYEELIKKALSKYKVIYKFDVGHVKPSMTMINGFYARVQCNENEDSLEYIK